MSLGDWLHREHVEPRSRDTAIAESVYQRAFIDDCAARAVDKVRGRFHKPQFARAEHASCLRVQWAIDRDEIALPQHRVEIGEFNAERYPSVGCRSRGIRQQPAES